MRLYDKLILTALTTAAVLAMAIGGAHARSFSTTEQNIEIAYDEALGEPRTDYQFEADGEIIECPVTMLGSFVGSTIRKEPNAVWWHIHHAEVGACRNGTATVRSETLPWTVRYRSFTGLLPRIRSVSVGLIGASFRVREARGLECESTTEVNHPGVFILGSSAEASETGFETLGDPKNVTAERANRIPLGGGFLCSFAGEEELGGIGLLTNLPGNEFITVHLI